MDCESGEHLEVESGEHLEVESGEHLEVRVTEGHPTLVHIAGELDIAGLPVLTAALDGHGPDVELHCAGLSFVGAAGVSAFVAAHQACVARGGKLVVVDPSRALLRVLDIVNLDTVLNIRYDCEQL